MLQLACDRDIADRVASHVAHKLHILLIHKSYGTNEVHNIANKGFEGRELSEYEHVMPTRLYSIFLQFRNVIVLNYNNLSTCVVYELQQGNFNKLSIHAEKLAASHDTAVDVISRTATTDVPEIKNCSLHATYTSTSPVKFSQSTAGSCRRIPDTSLHDIEHSSRQELISILTLYVGW
jgi:hypothetical protein